MDLFDSHCHLDAPEFDHDRDAVIERARRAGINRQLIPAVSRQGWAKLRDICHTHSGLHPAYGLHPMYLQEHQEQDLAILREWLEIENPCAIGECGLDFFVDDLDIEQQRFYFHGQCDLAREFQKPLILHARRAVDEMIHTCRTRKVPGGIVHSFSGSEEQARQLFEMGFCIGIGGPITYERAQRLRRLVQQMPLDYLVIETDAPDQPDSQHRGERNEPERLTLVAQTIAELRNMSIDELVQITANNAARVLKVPVF
jgi:TatD DNase family protein